MTIIFDMDGTLVDNSGYHQKAWEIFLQRHGIKGAEHIWKLFGNTNESIMKYFLKRELTRQEIQSLAGEKEEIYREIYAPVIKPVNGLMGFLDDIKASKIKVGLATSAPGENVEFVLRKIDAKQYFDEIVDDSQITKGKPDPEIFLTCARRLGADKSGCVVFEDAFHGVTAARNAEMKVVALTTSYGAKTLAEADLVIEDYTEINMDKINFLLNSS